MTERIYIPEIQKELQYKDRRSVRRWCRNNHLRIISDIGSNKQYVLKSEYENAKYKNYQRTVNSSMIFFPKNNKVKKANEYKPQGEHEKKFLNYLLNF